MFTVQEMKMPLPILKKRKDESPEFGDTKSVKFFEKNTILIEK